MTGDADAMLEVQIKDCLSNRDPAALVSVLYKEGLTASMVTRLDQLVTKELRSSGLSRVVTVIKTLSTLSQNTSNLQLLLKHGLIAKVLLWFEALLDLLTCEQEKTSAPMLSLTEEFYDYFLLLGRASIEVSQLSVVLLQLAQSSLEPGITFAVRLEAIRTFNSILESMNKTERRQLQIDKHHSFILNEMAAAVLLAGDYELQVSLSEALCRLTPRKDREHRANQWFTSPDIVRAFCNIRDCDFEVDCRSFLNFVNNHHGAQRRVRTFPCLRAFLGTSELFRPKDEKLDEFWIDFNISSECISFFVDDPQGSLWGTVHLLSEEVDSYSLQLKRDEYAFPEDKEAETILIVHLTQPIMHDTIKGQTVLLSFSSKYHVQVEEAVSRIFKTPKASGQWEGVEDNVHHLPSPAHANTRLYSRKKTQSKSQLKILPLSSPSSEEDSPCIQTCRNDRAERLFDQIMQSTPRHTDMHDSGFPLEVELENALDEEVKEVVGRRVHSKEKAVNSSDRKRAAPGTEQTGASPVIKRRAKPLPHTEDSAISDSLGDGEDPVGVEEGADGEEPVQGESVSESKSERKLRPGLTAAFQTIRGTLQKHFTGCYREVEAEVNVSLRECQELVTSLLQAVHQQRLVLLEKFESKLEEHLRQLEENETSLNSTNAQILDFFQSEVKRLTSFCKEQQQRMSVLADGPRAEAGAEHLSPQ